MAAVAARAKEFKDLNVEFLALSIDTIFTHKAWYDHELVKMVPGGFPFPMLSDPEGRIGSLYGVYDEEAKINLRGFFIIDPDGILQAMSILPPPVGRDVDEVLREIKSLQHVQATQGAEATPACWRPGQPTLKPGPELVGRVWEVWKP